jgi:hypothetical protein
MRAKRLPKLEEEMQALTYLPGEIRSEQNGHWFQVKVQALRWLVVVVWPRRLSYLMMTVTTGKQNG